jgi:hypothetical protein
MSTESAMDRVKARAEIERSIFSDALRRFVRDWAPANPVDRSEFQMALMRLFVDAMSNQSAHMTLGIETYASTMFAEAAKRPLHVIMEKPKP